MKDAKFDEWNRNCPPLKTESEILAEAEEKGARDMLNVCAYIHGSEKGFEDEVEEALYRERRLDEWRKRNSN